MYNHPNKIRTLLFIASTFIAYFFTASSVFASDAAIFLAPITGTYTTGATFTLSVMVGSGGEAINAIEGKLEYDPKEIEVVSIDKSSSVLTSWTVEPVFSNDTGDLSFGGLLATSTILSRGEVLKFTVHTLRTGELHIRFASGAAVHAADGTGGNILSQLSGGVYVTKPNVTDPTAPAAIQSGDAGLPAAQGEVLGAATGTAITSSTHPDQEMWYATSTAILDWGIPAGTASILLALDKHPLGEGVNAYTQDTHEKIIHDIKDGVWYFHLTRVNIDKSKDTSTFRIRVDMSLPTAFSVSEALRKDPSIPNVAIAVSATDTPSGVEHYTFKLDSGQELDWVDDGTHVRNFAGLSVGTHELDVFAVDHAGNRASGHLSFTIENLPTPSLTIMNSTFIEGDKLKLNLTSVPNATLDIQVARLDTSPATEEFSVDEKGKGIFESALPLQPGNYTVSVVAHNPLGAISKESARLTFEVNSSFIGVIKRHPMIPVALLSLIALLLLAWYFWKNMFGGNGDVDAGEEEDDHFEQEPISEGEALRKKPLQGGAVVLEKKKQVVMPVTRL